MSLLATQNILLSHISEKGKVAAPFSPPSPNSSPPPPQKWKGRCSSNSFPIPRSEIEKDADVGHRLCYGLPSSIKRRWILRLQVYRCTVHLNYLFFLCWSPYLWITTSIFSPHYVPNMYHMVNTFLPQENRRIWTTRHPIQCSCWITAYELPAHGT